MARILCLFLALCLIGVTPVTIKLYNAFAYPVNFYNGLNHCHGQDFLITPSNGYVEPHAWGIARENPAAICDQGKHDIWVWSWYPTPGAIAMTCGLSVRWNGSIHVYHVASPVRGKRNLTNCKFDAGTFTYHAKLP